MHEIIHTLEDTYLIFPILFIMYIVLEYFEHHQPLMDKKILKFGPIVGALFGLIPQCGFGVLASALFVENKITLGTLISIFIATSDEAIPLLITHSSMYSSLLYIIIMKVILGISIGYLIDYFNKYENTQSYSHITHNHKHSFFIEAFIRALKIYLFIFIVNLGLTYFSELYGEKQLSVIFMKNNLFQPLLAALFGFIPHCFSSVLLTQLFINNALSFPSLLAALITNSGLGLLTLIQYKVNIKMILKISIILLVTSLIVTLPLQWFHLL